MEQKCRVCGCTWNNACEGGCYWVEENLCSECVVEVITVGLKLESLVNEVKLKRKNFNNAFDDYIDKANYELYIAEEKLNNYIREMKHNARSNLQG